MKVYFLRFLLVFLMMPSLTLRGNTLSTDNHYERAAGHIAQCNTPEQREKALFLYGFYVAYMSGVMYDASGAIANTLLQTCAPELRKKYKGLDYMILIQGHDCVEENLETLYVTPIENDWFEVKFHRSEIKYSDQQIIPAADTRVRVCVKPYKRSYRIADLKEIKESSSM